MTPPIVQVDYEQMSDLSQRMQVQADSCVDLGQCLRRALAPLQQGGWDGRGAAAFFLEMEHEVLPALGRLETALTEGRSVLEEIVVIFRAAEEEARRPFQYISPVLPDNRTESQRDTSSDSSIPNHLLKPVFSHSYMQDMVGQPMRGAGDPELRAAMYVLRNNSSPEAVEQALNIIAEKCDMDPAVAREQYEKFKKMRSHAENSGKEEIAELWQLPGRQDYMGSHDHLRFGQIVGDALGLDPVFGALLNPTGGMVGPNNEALALNDSAPGYHAAFHDAGGFLYNHFGIGPGYDYLGRESHRPKDDPLTGQASGLGYWSMVIAADKVMDLMNDPTPARREALFDAIAAGVLSAGAGQLLGGLADARTSLQNTVRQAQDAATHFVQDTTERVVDMARNAAAQELQKYQKFVDIFF